MPRRPSRPPTPTKVTPFVVYVTFPSSPKEYAYWCDLPNVRQGSELVINNARVRVHRTAQTDDLVTKWVPNSTKEIDISRIRAVAQRLKVLEEQEACLARWNKPTSPEARRLVKELKELTR